MPEVKYKRVLLKISGEALLDENNAGISSSTLLRIARQVKLNDGFLSVLYCADSVSCIRLNSKRQDRQSSWPESICVKSSGGHCWSQH